LKVPYENRGWTYEFTFVDQFEHIARRRSLRGRTEDQRSIQLAGAHKFPELSDRELGQNWRSLLN